MKTQYKGFTLVKQGKYQYWRVQTPDGPKQFAFDQKDAALSYYFETKATQQMASQGQKQALNMPFWVVFNAYLGAEISRRVERSTLRQYRLAVNRMRDKVGDVQLQHFTPRVAQNYLDDLNRAGFSLGTITASKSLVVRLYDLLVRDQVIDVNRMIGLQTSLRGTKPEKNQPKILPAEVYRALMKRLKEGSLLARYDRLMVLTVDLMIHTAARPSEIRSITFSSIDFDNKLIRIETTLGIDGQAKDTKNRIHGDAPLSDDLVKRLQDWKTEQAHLLSQTSDTRVLLDQKGTPSVSKLDYHFDRMMRIEFGLPRTSLYWLRRSTASFISADVADGGAGVPLRTASVLLRHSLKEPGVSATTQKYYLANTDNAITAAYDQIREWQENF